MRLLYASIHICIRYLCKKIKNGEDTMKKVICTLLALTMVFSLAACGGSSHTKEESPTVKIAVDGAWTGDLAGNGEWKMNAIKMAADEINADGGVLGKQIEVIFEDNQSTQNGAINAMNKIVEDENVLAVIGPHMSTMAIAVSDTVAKSDIIYMTGGTSVALRDLHNDWMFKLRCMDDTVAKVAAEFAVNTLGCKNIGIMYNNDEFGTGGRDIICAYLDEHNIPWVAEGHNSGDSDYTGQILKLKQAQTDCMIIWTSGDASTIVKQRYELGYEGKVITSSSFASQWTLDTLNLEECVGVYSATDMSPDDPNPKMAALVEKTQAELGYEPEAWHCCYYTAVYILKDAIERAGSIDREAVKKALYETKDLDSVLGTIVCNEDGELVHECVITVVNGDKKLELVDKITVS